MKANADKEFAAKKAKREALLVEARQYRDWTDCTINNRPWAALHRIEDGIRYLHGVGGRPTQGPGPARCMRVSCSWDSAIYWCNDRNIADGAWVITQDCPVVNYGGYRETRGQRFHGNNWNVIVRGDTNSC
ncbi:hypothetical protein QBC38DRAFT_422012 [Podospora fimiseda]|uniref:Uncharacterized protein n=1 Tax=Podospora fimiseda TaxID=252190 RepID=A0AAN7GUF6_9PEZI|nr:hypothetical protein QBC38DRAFT_422012 [Podospora fimiseda]